MTDKHDLPQCAEVTDDGRRELHVHAAVVPEQVHGAPRGEPMTNRPTKNSTWKRLLCAFTFHSWGPWLIMGGNVVCRCTFCGAEAVR
jgi:hypothetical protein